MVLDQNELRSAYSGARVFVTGHTGFKGSWITAWLTRLGATVFGYALRPDTTPAMFDVLGLEGDTNSRFDDIRDLAHLETALEAAAPDYVFHLAAQPIVRLSYTRPLETIETNILGTANLLEAIRRRAKPCVVVVVTSDKCYENRDWVWGYRESDPMGGHDIYSMSKGAAELVVSSYRRSFFSADDSIRVASARAGNVIGGGDWAADRIVPDFARALASQRPLSVRSPRAVRPWQHVLEPVGAYLLLGARMRKGEDLGLLCDAWNFGPNPENSCTVAELIDEMVAQWGAGSWVSTAPAGALHEASQLRLSIDKAIARLGWRPRWDLRTTCARTSEWYRAFYQGTASMRDVTFAQIDDYTAPEAVDARRDEAIVETR